MDGTKTMSEYRLLLKWTSLVWLSSLCWLASSSAFAGGVIEELRTTSKALTADSSQGQAKSHAPCPLHKTPQKVSHQGVPELDHQRKKVGPELVSLYYDPVNKWTVVRWKPRQYMGQRAIRYHIYRWSLERPQRILIAKVEGDIFEFIDRSGVVGYFYNVVGIYHVDGSYQSWQYPIQQTISPVSLEPNIPTAGIGCQSLSSERTPGWLLLFLFPLLALQRRRRSHT